MTGLVAQRLMKRYQKRCVVNDLSLQVQAGEIVGLLGPNGAGKTTAFYMLVGLVAADDGVVTLDERDVTALPMHGRARLGIGYLPQEPSVFRSLNVADNIAAIVELDPTLSGDAVRHQTEALMHELKISHLSNTLGMSLSGGERRRVEIARALAARPRFMLLDEPFAGVDPVSIADIQAIVTHLKARGIGILITDHNVRETLGICDRAYIVDQGTVLAEGAPSVILDNPQVRRVYLGEGFKM
jgi:lipopolysaccharide export system ATP-binding protein